MSDDEKRPRRGEVQKPFKYEPPFTGASPYSYNGHGNKGNAEEYSEFQREVGRQRNRRDASRFLDNESWTQPSPGCSLAEARLDPPSPVRFTINELLPDGISMLAAQFKVGKTTLGINLAASLASGEDFLDWFEVDEIAGNIGYWNMEVNESQMFAWQDQIVTRGADRIFTAHLRGHRMDLLSDITAEWTVSWLTAYDVDVWILDPIGRMLDDENSSSEFNRWFKALEEIVSKTKVRSTLLMHHSGHAESGNEDTIPRARGASAMLGNTDVNINYRHGGKLGEVPPDSYRYLSAFGRGVEVSEITVGYDKGTGRLYMDECAQTRQESRIDRGIDNAVAVIEEAGNWVLNKGDLKKAMKGSSNDKDAIIDTAVQDGRLVTRRKAGSTAILYGIPE